MFERLLRNVPHGQPITNKYQDFERFLAEVLDIQAADIYTVHLANPGNFDVRMTQSTRAREASLRVGLVPSELDIEWNWAYFNRVASRLARDRYPGTAVLLVCDGLRGWRPRWAIEPADSRLPPAQSGALPRFAAWFDDFELQTYPRAERETLPAEQDGSDTTPGTREGITVNLTAQEEQLLRAISAHPEVTEKLYQLDPDLFARLIEDDISARDVVALAHRRSVVDRFRRLLTDPDYFSDAAEAFGGSKEKVWQNLLEENPWILGVSLAGQLLTSWSNEKLEQVVAGHSISGPGKRTDALMRTNGRIRAMVFAEIKHHKTALLGSEYKSGSWAPSSELSGAVVQIQRTVQLANRQIRERLDEEDETGAEIGEHTYMVRPREFVILGNLEELRGPSGVHRGKYESFELYRRNLYEPEILTFDELLARAEWHVEAADQEI